MNRHRAAAIHLSLSILVCGSVLAAILVLWYPGAWFESMGGKNLILLLTGVDIVIGPLLTWIVFRPGKKTLKFDLSVIVILQVSAMLYGLHTVYVARPVYMVLVKDQFRAVTAVELDDTDFAKHSIPEFRTLPITGPRVASSFMPTDKDERSQLAYMAVMQGIDLHQLPQYWKPYDGSEAKRIAHNLRELRGIAAENPAAIDTFLKDHNRQEASLRFIPLRTRHKDLATLIDADNGAVVGILDAKPWR